MNYEELADQFHKKGYVIIPNALTSDQVAKLRRELEAQKMADPQKGGKKYATTYNC